MLIWNNIRSYGLDTLIWWENIVKPGVKKLAMKRGRDIQKSNREELNLLRIRQCYLHRKLVAGELCRHQELRAINEKIRNKFHRFRYYNYHVLPFFSFCP